MIVFVTNSGSRYELDMAQKRIRRISGKPNRHAERVGLEEWKPFEAISTPTIGDSVLIRWPATVPLFEGSPAGSIPATITSPVTELSTVPDA